MTSLESQIHEIVSSLIASCLALIEKIQMGCDGHIFLACVKKATEETHRLFTFVLKLETTNLASREELLNETVVVKNVVIKLIQQARVFHKSVPPNAPAATPQQLAPFRTELSTAIRQLKSSSDRFIQAEIQCVVNCQPSSPQGQSSLSPPGAGTPGEYSPREMTMVPEDSATTRGKDIAEIAMECLETIATLSQALQQREREPFASAVKMVITLVNQLVSTHGDKEVLAILRQNLVGFISHSKKYFVNPEDENIKNNFLMCKEKVERDIQGMIPEGYTVPIRLPQKFPIKIEDDAVWACPRSPSLPITTPMVSLSPPSFSSPPRPPDVDGASRQTDGGGGDKLISQSSSRGKALPTPPTSDGIDFPKKAATSPLLRQNPFFKASTIPVSPRGEAIPEEVENPSSRKHSLTKKKRSDSYKPLPPIPTDRQPRLGTCLTEPLIDINPGILEADRDSDQIVTDSEDAYDDVREGDGDLDDEADPTHRGADDIEGANDEDASSDEIIQGKSELDKVGKFENVLRPRLKAYKKQLGSQLTQKPRDRAGETQIPKGQNSTLRGVPLSSTLTSGKQPTRPGPRKADTFKFQRKYILLREIELTGSPRSTLGKQISGYVCTILGILHQLVSDFSDNGKSYINPEKYDKHSDKTEKLFNKTLDETKDALREKLYDSKGKLFEKIKESMEVVMTQYVEPGCSLDTVRQRIKENINNISSKEGEQLKIDEKLFSQGQYIRLMKQILLRSITSRSDAFFYATSQFLAVMTEFDVTNTSYCFHFLCIGNIFVQVMMEILNDFETFFYLYGKEREQRVHKKHIYIGQKGKHVEGNTSIWKEKEESNGSGKEDIYRAGTLNSLIIRMTDKAFNSDLMMTFLAGHELFSDSKEVWEKFEDRYSVPKNLEDEKTSFIKMRVTTAVLHWIKNDLHTIDSQVLKQIDKFSEKTLKKDQFDDLSRHIREELDKVGRYASLPDNVSPTSVPVFGLNNLQPYQLFLCGDSKGIAEQITIIEFHIYSRIGRSELLNGRWSREKHQILSRNVISLIQRSNRLSHFVATSILLQEKQKDRTQVLCKVIKIAQALAELQNYNGLMGVLMGLTLSSIQRLRLTWSKLPQKYDTMYKQLALYQDPSNSFKNYRDAIKAQSGNACVPYFTVYLTDLTFIDENPEFIETEDGGKLINFPKHQLIQRTIKQIQQFQNSKYDLQTKEPLYTFLYQMPGLEEKELYTLSIEREARRAN